MQFRTELNTIKSIFQLTHQSKILTTGSCFAENIAALFLKNKFNCISNPYGILYNPISIFNSLACDFSFNTQNFVFRDDLYFSYDCHSDINATSVQYLAIKLATIQKNHIEKLKNTDIVIITFGTGYVYENMKKNIVANCHKKNTNLFKKRLLNTDEIVVAFEKIQNQILEINPNLNFIFTISPVRHIKDTIALNQVSKSILRLAVHYICEKHTNCNYFPAYEIMMDDLRDYRFYDSDMLHPTPFAIEYIWKKFIFSYFTESTLKVYTQWQHILSSINHRSFNPTSTSHQQFLNQLLNDLANFEIYFDVSIEKSLLKSKLLT